MCAEKRLGWQSGKVVHQDARLQLEAIRGERVAQGTLTIPGTPSQPGVPLEINHVNKLVPNYHSTTCGAFAGSGARICWRIAVEARRSSTIMQAISPEGVASAEAPVGPFCWEAWDDAGTVVELRTLTWGERMSVDEGTYLLW